MADPPAERPSRVVRDRVIEKLTLNFAHSNLDDEEFEERLSRATNASSTDELLALVNDLPDIAAKNPPSAMRDSTGVDESAVAINTGQVKEEGALVAILGGSTRKGVWRPPRHLRIFAMMGGVELDFTEAEMAPGVTEITVFTVMGGIDITVPLGLNVDMTGIPLLGGFDDKSAGMVDPDAPTLKIRGLAVMGGVDVKLPRKHRRYLRERRRSRDHGRSRDRQHWDE